VIARRSRRASSQHRHGVVVPHVERGWNAAWRIPASSAARGIDGKRYKTLGSLGLEIFLKAQRLRA